MKHILIFALAFSTITCMGQTTKKALKALNGVNSFEEAQALIGENSDWKFKKVTAFMSYEAVPEGNPEAFIDNVNDEIWVKRLIKGDEVLSYHASIMSFDGTLLNHPTARAMRDSALQQYNSGVPFSELKNKWVPTQGRKGDLGWFPAGLFPDAVEKALKSHKKGEIFFASDEYGSHHLILKTEEEKMRPAMKWIMIRIE